MNKGTRAKKQEETSISKRTREKKKQRIQVLTSKGARAKVQVVEKIL